MLEVFVVFLFCFCFFPSESQCGTRCSLSTQEKWAWELLVLPSAGSQESVRAKALCLVTDVLLCTGLTALHLCKLGITPVIPNCEA